MSQSLLDTIFAVPRPAFSAQTPKPVIGLDGARVDDRDQPLVGQNAFVLGANDKTFPAICARLRVQTLAFYEMRVADLSPLAQVETLKNLSINWNTKLTDLTALSKLDLSALQLEDTPKIADLAPLAKMRGLEALEVSGGMASPPIKLDSLTPIAKLPGLRDLRLTNIRTSADGLRPLAALSHLETLRLAYTFPTEDYAYLAAHLPETDCDAFAGIVPLESPLPGGSDTMIVGSRKPILNAQKDAARIAKYAASFEALKATYLEEITA